METTRKLSVFKLSKRRGEKCTFGYATAARRRCRRERGYATAVAGKAGSVPPSVGNTCGTARRPTGASCIFRLPCRRSAAPLPVQVVRLDHMLLKVEHTQRVCRRVCAGCGAGSRGRRCVVVFGQFGREPGPTRAAGSRVPISLIDVCILWE